MGLSRELIEKEIIGSEAALKAHEDGVEIHQLVLAMFKKKLAEYKLPVEKEKKE